METQAVQHEAQAVRQDAITAAAERGIYFRIPHPLTNLFMYFQLYAGSASTDAVCSRYVTSCLVTYCETRCLLIPCEAGKGSLG